MLTAHLLPMFGERTLASITPQQVRSWHSDLLADAPSMRAQVYQLLRAIMASAVSDELIDSNPCRIRGAGQPRRRHTISVASVAELEAIEAAMPERLRLMVSLASWCSLRFGEIIELRRGDLVLAAEVIRVRRGAVVVKGRWVIGDPKTEAGIRDVAIPPHLLRVIEAHLAEHVDPQQDALLFPATRNGENMRQSTMHWHFSRARKAAGRPDLRFHDLRHTGLTMAAQAGATTAELMARAGHSSAEAALRYQHAAQARDREIAQQLSKMYESG